MHVSSLVHLPLCVLYLSSVFIRLVCPLEITWSNSSCMCRRKLSEVAYVQNTSHPSFEHASHLHPTLINPSHPGRSLPLVSTWLSPPSAPAVVPITAHQLLDAMTILPRFGFCLGLASRHLQQRPNPLFEINHCVLDVCRAMVAQPKVDQVSS